MPNTWRTDSFMSGSLGRLAVGARLGLRTHRTCGVLGVVSAGARAIGAAASRISDEARLLQKVIGLDNLAQLVPGARVAAVGVGMMALTSSLKRDLISTLRGRARKIERLQALFLERLQLAAALGRLLARGLGAPREERVRIERATAEAAVAPVGHPGGGCRSRRQALAPTFQVGRWPVSASFWKSWTSVSFMPSK